MEIELDDTYIESQGGTARLDRTQVSTSLEDINHNRNELFSITPFEPVSSQLYTLSQLPAGK